MNITHLRYVAIATPEFERSRAFFTEAWGLRDTGIELHGRAFCKRSSTNHFNSRSFPARNAESIASRLVSRHATTSMQPRAISIGQAFRRSRRRTSWPRRAADTAFNFSIRQPLHRSIRRCRARTGGSGAVPQKLAHIVVNTPDIDRATAFYATCWA